MAAAAPPPPPRTGRGGSRSRDGPKNRQCNPAARVGCNQSRSASILAPRQAMVSMLIIGLTPLAVGKQLASIT